MEKLFVVQRPNGTHIGAYTKKEWAEDKLYDHVRWFERRFQRLPGKNEMPAIVETYVDLRSEGGGMN